MRTPSASRRTRLIWLGTLATGALLAGCATSSGLHPVSLDEQPPKDPPPRTALPQDPTGTQPTPADSPTAASGLRINCATFDLPLPGGWTSTATDNGAAVKVPDDEGGGLVSITGTYFTGADAQQSQSSLESAVRGDDGDAVTLEQSRKDRVIGHLPAKRGTEWRVAQAFPDQRSELVKISYAPAGGASDQTVTATSSVLQEAVGKARVLDPGECDSGT
jgi:hypothetical protein